MLLRVNEGRWTRWRTLFFLNHHRFPCFPIKQENRAMGCTKPKLQLFDFSAVKTHNKLFSSPLKWTLQKQRGSTRNWDANIWAHGRKRRHGRVKVWPFTLYVCVSAASFKLCLRLGSAAGELLLYISVNTKTSLLLLISKARSTAHLNSTFTSKPQGPP